MGFAGFNGLSGWQASLGYISYWVERANGPKGLSLAIGNAMGVRQECGPNHTTIDWVE